MKSLLPLAAVFLLSACASSPPAPSPAAAEPAPVSAAAAAVQSYPAWLEMKPGYEEACINAGGCIPMTQAELNGLAAEIMQRTLQACRRTPTI